MDSLQFNDPLLVRLLGASSERSKVIANNLANVNTNGFKRMRVDFQDLIYQTLTTPGTTAGAGTEIPTGIQVGHGSRVAATQRIFSLCHSHTINPLTRIENGHKKST